MKLKFLLIISFCSIPHLSLASDTDIPNTAQLLYSLHSSIQSEQEAIDLGQSWILQGESTYDVNLQCRSVYYKWTYDWSFDCDIHNGSMILGGCVNPFNRLAGAEFNVHRTVALSAYCDPRELGQKALIATMRACEKNFVEACFQIVNQLNSIQPTQRFDIDKP